MKQDWLIASPRPSRVRRSLLHRHQAHTHNGRPTRRPFAMTITNTYIFILLSPPWPPRFSLSQHRD
jgi:hypothetical protein